MWISAYARTKNCIITGHFGQACMRLYYYSQRAFITLLVAESALC